MTRPQWPYLTANARQTPNFEAVRHLFHPLTDAEIEELMRKHGCGAEEAVSLDDVGLRGLAAWVIAERHRQED